jgi:cytochrome P450
MTNKERLASFKPVIGGVVVGAIATLIVGFSGGWLVTTNTMADEVRSAQVAAYAEVCAANSVADWKGNGQTMAALEGWDNRDAREALAKRFMPAAAGELTSDIQRACERGIQSAT